MGWPNTEGCGFMRAFRWCSLLWPGLPQLWFAGAWSGLGMALGFALLVDLGLLTSRVWTEVLSPEARGMLWLVVAGIWLTAAIVSCRWVARLRPNSQPASGSADLFETARSEYLRGHWFEAETALQRLLDINPLDREARLMLATLLRAHRAFRRIRGTFGSPQPDGRRRKMELGNCPPKGANATTNRGSGRRSKSSRQR